MRVQRQFVPFRCSLSMALPNVIRKPHERWWPFEDLIWHFIHPLASFFLLIMSIINVGHCQPTTIPFREYGRMRNLEPGNPDPSQNQAALHPISPLACGMRVGHGILLSTQNSQQNVPKSLPKRTIPQSHDLALVILFPVDLVEDVLIATSVCYRVDHLDCAYEHFPQVMHRSYHDTRA